MTGRFKMPLRQPGDSSFAVKRLGNDYLQISYPGDTCEPYVCSGLLTVSPYNAARIFGALALFLDITLPKQLAKAITLFEPDRDNSFAFGAPEPQTLGERLAQQLVADAMPVQIGGFRKAEDPPGDDGSCPEDDASCDCLWHENLRAAKATRPPEPVTIRAKLLELDASNADGLVRLAFDMPMAEARRLAPFLFEDAAVTFGKPGAKG